MRFVRYAIYYNVLRIFFLIDISRAILNKTTNTISPTKTKVFDFTCEGSEFPEAGVRREKVILTPSHSEYGVALGSGR